MSSSREAVSEMRTIMVKSSDCPIWNSLLSILQTWPTRARRPVCIQYSPVSFEFDTAQMNACSQLPEKTMKKCCCKSSKTKYTTSITKTGASAGLLATPTAHADRPLCKSRMGNTGTFRSPALALFCRYRNRFLSAPLRVSNHLFFVPRRDISYPVG